MRIGLCDDKRVSFSIVVFRRQQANYLYRGLHEHYDGQTWSASTTVNCSCHVFARAGWFCSEVLVWWTCICTISIWMRPQIVGKQNDLKRFMAHSCFLYNSFPLSHNIHSSNNKQCAIYRTGNLLCPKQHTLTHCTLSPNILTRWSKLSIEIGSTVLLLRSSLLAFLVKFGNLLLPANYHQVWAIQKNQIKDLKPTARLAVGITMLFAGEWAVFVVFEMSWKLERGTGSWIESSKIHQLNPTSDNDLRRSKAYPIIASLSRSEY